MGVVCASLTFAVPSVRRRRLMPPDAAAAEILRQRPRLMLVVTLVLRASLPAAWGKGITGKEQKIEEN